MAWASEGPLTDPSNGDLLADTGPLPALGAGFSILADSNAACYVNLVLRNSLNTTDLFTQKLYVHPSTPNPLASISMTPGLNQRLLVRAAEAVVGTIQVSILR